MRRTDLSTLFWSRHCAGEELSAVSMPGMRSVGQHLQRLRSRSSVLPGRLPSWSAAVVAAASRRSLPAHASRAT